MKRTLVIVGMCCMMSLFAIPVFAQAPGDSRGFIPENSGSNPVSGTQSGTNPSTGLPTLKNPLKADNVEKLLLDFVDLLIFVGVIVAFFMFIFIGFKFVWAQGKPDAVADAKRWFLWAVVGTAVLISSKVIVEVVKNTLVSAGVVKEEYFRKP